MSQREINPYQPVVLTESSAVDPDSRIEVSLPVGARMRRLATNQYLLRWHPKRLFFGSLVIIGISTLAIHFSVLAGRLAFGITLPTVMILTALLYEALVRRTRNQIAAKMDSLGLTDDQYLTLCCEPDWLVLATDRGTAYQWSYDSTQFYRTSKGVLVCPEPLLFFLLPRKMDNTRPFLELLRARVADRQQDSN